MIRNLSRKHEISEKLMKIFDPSKKASIATTTAAPPKKTSKWCAPIGTLTCACHETSKLQSMCMTRVSIGKIAQWKCCVIHRIQNFAREWTWSIRLLFLKVIYWSLFFYTTSVSSWTNKTNLIFSRRTEQTFILCKLFICKFILSRKKLIRCVKLANFS